MTLADVLNSETEKEFEGVRYKLRQMSMDDEGQFQRWLEQLAYDAIERRTYATPERQDKEHKSHINDCAAGVYEWGQELAVRRAQTVRGYAKILHLVCQSQGLTEEKALQWAQEKAKETAGLIVQRVLGIEDPKDLAAVCLSLGLPPGFLSPSQTRRSTTRSDTSDASAEPNSSDSTKSSEAPTG